MHMWGDFSPVCGLRAQWVEPGGSTHLCLSFPALCKEAQDLAVGTVTCHVWESSTVDPVPGVMLKS